MIVCFLLHFFSGAITSVKSAAASNGVSQKKSSCTLCGSGTVMTTCHQNAEGSERQGFLSTSLQGTAFLHCSVLSPETQGPQSLHSYSLKHALIINFHQGFQTLSHLYLASSL